MQEIFSAMVPERAAEKAADETVSEGTVSEAADAEVNAPENGAAEDTGVATDEVAPEPLATDGEWVFADETDGVSFRRLGKPAGRVMIVALPDASLEHIRISEMTAIAAIPSGYQIIEAILPSGAHEAVSPVQAGAVEKDIHFLQAVYDQIRAEGVGNIYFMGYDTAVPIGILALKDRDIKRAYFVSPDFRVPDDTATGEAGAAGSDESDAPTAEGSRPVKYVYGPWRVDTEVLRGSRDDVVSEKEIRHFLKNSRSHLSKLDMGHHMTEENQLAAFGRWLTGARNGRYVDNGFILMMAVGLLAGYLAGYLITKNSAVGLFVGAACGIILNVIYKKI